MKKILAVCLLLIMTLSLTGGCSAQEATGMVENIEIILTIGQPVMLVNGIEQRIDVEGTTPLLLEGRTLLPVRAVIEAMDGTVTWDGEAQMVTLKKNEDIIRLVIDSETAYLNDVPEVLDVAPTMINDRTMLPIRFIAESFHFQVKWEEESQRVILTENTQETTEPTTPPATDVTMPPTETPVSEPETSVVPGKDQITVTVNGQHFTAELEDNETAKAFYAMLPMTLEMDELNGNEKYYFLNESLPADSRDIGQIQTGDLMLYGSNCIVSFFKTFSTSYTYTPIGHINDAAGYAAALPGGRVTITFSK